VATVAPILAYSTEKSLSKTPERFGRGAIEGVAAPEAANNGATCGSFVPLLTLGVPGSGVTAVLLGAFIMYGITPGPMLFQNNPDVVWGLINSMYIGNVMLLILNIPLVPVFARILYMPPALLVPMILMISTVGIYGLNGTSFDLLTMVAIGVLGYLFRISSIPISPLILACVLGGMLEQRFRQSMTLSGGELDIFVHSTISTVLLLMTVGVVLMSVFMAARRARRRARSDTKG
jgi:putative tricarboxylic transport membrane protein